MHAVKERGEKRASHFPESNERGYNSLRFLKEPAAKMASKSVSCQLRFEVQLAYMHTHTQPQKLASTLTSTQIQLTFIAIYFFVIGIGFFSFFSFKFSLCVHSSLLQIKNCESETESCKRWFHIFSFFNNFRPLIKETFKISLTDKSSFLCFSFLHALVSISFVSFILFRLCLVGVFCPYRGFARVSSVFSYSHCDIIWNRTTTAFSHC